MKPTDIARELVRLTVVAALTFVTGCTTDPDPAPIPADSDGDEAAIEDTSSADIPASDIPSVDIPSSDTPPSDLSSEDSVDMWSFELSEAEEAALEAISPTHMRDHIDYLAADAQAGRIPGTAGHERARNYIITELESYGLEPFGDDGTFIDEYDTDRFGGRYMFDGTGQVVPHENDTGRNVVALLRGDDPAIDDEAFVYIAHYDHLGVTQEGEALNGAFDNASGVSVGLEIARVLSENDAEPGRSVVFLFTDDDEQGLIGARHWVRNPPLPLDDVVVAVSADPLGRTVLPDTRSLIIVGLERSPDLLELWRGTQAFTESRLVFTHRLMIAGFGSDQDEFLAQSVPAAWILNPGFAFYHKTTDDPETIDYRALLDGARYLTQVILLIGNSDQRFDYIGSPLMDGQTALDARALFDELLTSSHLSSDERIQLEGYVSQLNEVVEADTFNIMDNALLFIAEAMLFSVFDLSEAHVGEIPPPFPGE